MGIFSSKSSIEDPEAFIEQSLKKAKVIIFSKSYCPYCVATKNVITKLDGVDCEIFELDHLGEPRNGPVQQALQKRSGILRCRLPAL